MLVKEYRILLPFCVEEYQRGQLYMIQKKSRLESSGAGSRVEIHENRPFEDGPGGTRGQYTYKIYHIGDRIPSWMKSLLPGSFSNIEAHEEAWNAYPYTRTRYSCPLLEKFSIDVETRYLNDAGTTENVFRLQESELKETTTDVMDFVNDPISSHDYFPDEDPKLYSSRSTGRGPLSAEWVDTTQREGKPLMCAYKLCKVEFRYWGLQCRVERWIHDLALRGTMMRAHRQAWAWQDEWMGLSMDDIRKLEHEAQLYLSGIASDSARDGLKHRSNSSPQPTNSQRDSVDSSEMSMSMPENGDDGDGEVRSESGDVYFDCIETPQPSTSAAGGNRAPMIRWNSELLVEEGVEMYEEEHPSPSAAEGADDDKHLVIVFFHGAVDTPQSGPHVGALRSTLRDLLLRQQPDLSSMSGRVHVLGVKCGDELAACFEKMRGICPAPDGSPSVHSSASLLLAAESESFPRAVQAAISKANEVISSHNATAQSNYDVFIVGDALGGLIAYEALLAESQSEISVDARPKQSLRAHSSVGRVERTKTNSIGDHSPSRLSTSSGNKFTYGSTAMDDNNNADQASRSLFEQNFAPDTPADAAVADSASSRSTEMPVSKPNTSTRPQYTRNLSAPVNSRANRQSTSSTDTNWEVSISTTASSGNDGTSQQLTFRPKAVFIVGSPLGLVLMQRKMRGQEPRSPDGCPQLVNLYRPSDPLAARLEPTFNSQLASLPPLHVPPLCHSNETHPQCCSAPCGLLWGAERLDYELTEGSANLDYWASEDVAEFILERFLSSSHTRPPTAVPPTPSATEKDSQGQVEFNLRLPIAVWNRRRTRFKVSNLAPNHRANDLLVLEEASRVVHARFCYGPMDLVALSQETVLVYICPSGAQWLLHSKAVTDSHGRLAVDFGDLPLLVGIHAVRMIVSGDHSFLDTYVGVVPSNSPIAVFSIDGSLTASVSVSGRDPRVRAGAVDVVRQWKQRGCIILYVTARPDMQQRLVSSWLAQHNFPHGFLYFTPSFSTDPLRQKAQLLKRLITDVGLQVEAAYGSSKDIGVYSFAGVEPTRIYKVGSTTRRREAETCVIIESGYAPHLRQLNSSDVGGEGAKQTGEVPQISKQRVRPLASAAVSQRPRALIQRTDSFSPRSGRWATTTAAQKKQISTKSTLR